MSPMRARTGRFQPTTSKRKKDEERSESEDNINADASFDDSEEDAKALDSDAIDEDDFPVKRSKPKNSPRKKKAASDKKPPKKRRKGGDYSDDDELELAEGQEVAGSIVSAPTTGQVPPGQISCNTLDFLSELKKPECNDREWFKLHEPVYRQAEKEWKAFIEDFTPLIIEADIQIPLLPPKDVIHRIYRDIRFSNDKTPYKTNFSASFSRSGRKGVFAGYHISIKPGGGSIIGAGSWCPGRNELDTIRHNIKRSSRRLRGLISAPQFVKHFGEAKSGKRSNIFGREDELKTAPKGVDKSHPDIDLLKCRSFAVFYTFKDEEVLRPDFKDKLKELVQVLRPFVHCLNDMMTIRDDGNDSSEEDE